LSSSAKPSETVIVPDFPVRRLLAAHVIKDEAIRIEPSSSASNKYDVEIMVLE